MDPIGQIPVITATFILLCKPGDHNTGPRDRLCASATIPDMALLRKVVARTIQLVFICQTD